jgi:hypothetical protein
MLEDFTHQGESLWVKRQRKAFNSTTTNLLVRVGHEQNYRRWRLNVSS